MAHRLTDSELVEFAGTDGILKILADATQDEYANGLLWYDRAHRFARKVSVLTGHRLETVAAVIARLSPQVSWRDNKLAAWEILTQSEYAAATRCYPDNVHRAEDIAAADSVAAVTEHVLPRKGYARPKISAFYRNIADPTCDGIATVDTWAIRVWLGDVLSSARTVSLKQSKAIQRDYVDAGQLAGLLSHQLQAVVWVAAHRLAKEGLQRNLFDFGLTFKI